MDTGKHIDCSKANTGEHPESYNINERKSEKCTKQSMSESFGYGGHPFVISLVDM